MELYLFRHETFRSLYNCSYFSDEEWWTIRKPNLWYGVFLIVIGTVYSVCILLLDVVTYRANKFEHAGYKLIFYSVSSYLGKVFISNCFTGYLSITGSAPCPNIDTLFLIRQLEEFFWACQSCSVIIMILGRYAEIWKPRYLAEAFEGRNTYFVILATVLYAVIYAFFVKAPFYNSNIWSANPYQGIKGFELIDAAPYKSYFFIFHNVTNAMIIIPMYTFLVISLWIKGKSAGAAISKAQKRIILLTSLLSLSTSTYSLIYAYMSVFQLSETGAQIVFLVRQITMGSQSVIHLTLNKGMRTGVLELFKTQRSTRITHFTASNARKDATNCSKEIV